MDAAQFRRLVPKEFPQLREAFAECEGLLHLQMLEFLLFTQTAIKERSYETVAKCFKIATFALSQGNVAVRYAVCVSFLEGLDFRGVEGGEALLLMPPELKKGLDEIL